MGPGPNGEGRAAWGADFRIYLPDGKTPFPREETPMARALRGESPSGVEMLIHPPGTAGDGSWISCTARPLRDATQTITGAVVAIQDITAKKHAEQALQRQAAELARSNAELQQFAYVASHDLQEPLRMVASYTQMLAKRYQGRLDAQADEFIGFAVDGAHRMQRLISDLLTYSRVGTRGRQPRQVPSGDAVGRALHHLQAAIIESDATVIRGQLPEVLADELQLTQLFQNLVGNAIKFRGVTAPRVEITAARDDDAWHFAVRDNGIGLEPQYAERIFGMFQRLHTPAEYPGSGIGLAICKRIVERHGGRIWVESALGEGSCVHVTLPAAQ
jgi:light-regulated signal transduction histidine kinase (bacteriophytochrome)